VRRLLAGACVLLLCGPAAALVVDAEDDEAYRSPPHVDLGWAHVGQRASMSVIYLGDGWVLTARHVGAGETTFDGVVYPLVPGSAVRLLNADRTPVDLLLYRVDPAPALPPLALAKIPPHPGKRVFLVGFGKGRGEAFKWNGKNGFRWQGRNLKRWGTNRVSGTAVELTTRRLRTRCFELEFERPGTRHEAQAALGDSGGAVFVRRPRGWKLAGVMVAVSARPGQEPNTALMGNFTSAADLSYYRAQILRVMEDTRSTPDDASATGN
jgi:hypothetical protein